MTAWIILIGGQLINLGAFEMNATLFKKGGERMHWDDKCKVDGFYTSDIQEPIKIFSLGFFFFFLSITELRQRNVEVPAAEGTSSFKREVLDIFKSSNHHFLRQNSRNT